MVSSNFECCLRRQNLSSGVLNMWSQTSSISLGICQKCQISDPPPRPAESDTQGQRGVCCLALEPGPRNDA